jgi:hypothetical protein
VPVDVTINNQVISYPVSGDPPGWGEGATQAIVEIADVLTELLGPNDISQTTFSVANNISVFTTVNGLDFDPGEVRAAEVQYSIYRISDSNPSGNAEAGTIKLVYDNDAATNSKWIWSVGPIAGNSGVTFNVTDAGQFQYKTTDIGSVGYSGTMTFRAKAILSNP